MAKTNCPQLYMMDTTTTASTLQKRLMLFPLTLYYKKDKGVGDSSFLLGVGFTLIYSRMELEGSAVWPQKFTETKMFPHVTAGAEYRFSEQFALGLDIKYNINAKVEKVVDGEELVLSDRSGLGAALTGRFYF